MWLLLDMFMKNDYPLVIRYFVASLGNNLSLSFLKELLVIVLNMMTMMMIDDDDEEESM